MRFRRRLEERTKSKYINAASYTKPIVRIVVFFAFALLLGDKNYARKKPSESSERNVRIVVRSQIERESRISMLQSFTFTDHQLLSGTDRMERGGLLFFSLFVL